MTPAFPQYSGYKPSLDLKNSSPVEPSGRKGGKKEKEKKNINSIQSIRLSGEPQR
jgi:hypothetical protein